MKIFTYMCAIENKTYDGSKTFPSGYIEIGDTKIYDWNKKGWGEITYDFGFEMSSNVAVSYIVQNFINKEQLKSCFNSYGFGSETGIELPRELSGKVVFNYPVEVAAAAYGQGISTTPIQHLQALSIIANNGVMVKPNIVQKIVQDGKTTYEREVSKSEQIVSKETVDYIKNLMYNTVNDVENKATGIAYRVNGLSLIGKTGTAQLYDSANGGYLTGYNDYIYSFSGMFPKEDPEIIIFASIKRPNNGSSSSLSQMLQPAIESIAKYKGYIYGGASTDSPVKFEVENYINENVNIIKEKLNSILDVVVLGDGDTIINQYPIVNSTILTGDKIYLVTNGNKLMPNLTNYSRIDAISVLNLLNIEYEINGYGYVIEQSILPGKVIDDKVILTLKNEDERE